MGKGEAWVKEQNVAPMTDEAWRAAWAMAAAWIPRQATPDEVLTALGHALGNYERVVAKMHEGGGVVGIFSDGQNFRLILDDDGHWYIGPARPSDFKRAGVKPKRARRPRANPSPSE